MGRLHSNWLLSFILGLLLSNTAPLTLTSLLAYLSGEFDVQVNEKIRKNTICLYPIDS